MEGKYCLLNGHAGRLLGTGLVMVDGHISFRMYVQKLNHMAVHDCSFSIIFSNMFSRLVEIKYRVCRASEQVQDHCSRVPAWQLASFLPDENFRFLAVERGSVEVHLNETNRHQHHCQQNF